MKSLGICTYPFGSTYPSVYMGKNTPTPVQTPQSVSINPQNSGLNDLANRWLKEADTKSGTKYTYSYCFKYFIEWVNQSNLRLQEMNHDHIMLYKTYLKEVLKSKNSQALYLRAVRSFFKWWDRNGGRDISKGVTADPIELNYLKDYVTMDEYQRVLDAIDVTTLAGFRDYAIVKLMMATGMRTMSVRDLIWGDFTTLQGTPALNYRKKGKGHATDVVPLTRAILVVLEKYKIMMANAGAPVGAMDYMFPVIGGEWGMMCYKNIYLRLVEYMTRAGVYEKGRKTPHSFRHGAATNILEKTDDRKLVKLMLGHSNDRSTDIYVAQADRRNSMSKLEDIGL